MSLGKVHMFTRASIRAGSVGVIAAGILLLSSANVQADKFRLWGLGGGAPTGKVGEALDALESGKLAEADDLFRQAIAANPELIIATLGRAQIAITEQRLSAADKMVSDVLQRHPELPEAHNMRGVVLLLQKRTAESRTAFMKAAALNPRFVTPHLYLAAIARAAADYPETIREYQELTKLAPRLPAGYIGKAEAQMMTGKSADAFATLRGWKLADPKSTLPFQVIAALHVANGAPRLALEELGGAMRLDARDPVTLTALGSAHLALGEVPAATAQFNLALSIDASHTMARLGLADIALRSGDLEGAKAAYRSVLKVDAGNTMAQNNLAWILADQGRDLDEALKLAEAATKREPEYVDGHDTLGWVHYRRAEYARAIAAFSKAKSLDPARGDIAAHLGMAYAKAGRKQEALTELRRALQWKGELSNRREVETLIATLAQ